MKLSSACSPFYSGFAVFVSFLFMPLTHHAASIIWGSPTNISGVGDVSTAGSLYFAANLGNSSSVSASSIWGPASEATVNGISFGGFYLNTMTTSSGFPVSTKALFSPIHVNNAANGLTLQGTTNTTFGVGAAFAALDASYQLLLGQGAYSGVNSTLTFSNLTIGQQYQFQWWTNDSRSLAASGRTVTATSGNAVTLDSNTAVSGNGLGQFALGTFTADATTQAIVFSGSSGPQISAFQLSAIPEPSSWMLFGLGTFALLCFRSRAHQSL